MSNVVAENPPNVASVAEPRPFASMVEGFRIAATALADMQQSRIMPTAQAYELWLAFHMNVNPSLTEKMSQMLVTPEKLGPDWVEQMRAEFGLERPRREHEPGPDVCTGVSERLFEASLAMSEHVASGRAAIRDYGEALARGVVDLSANPSREEVVRVIATLTGNTQKAADRNRALSMELAETAARVEKLRKLLLDERKAANTDQLTGLANRREFEARMKRTLRQVVAEPGSPASLLMLDIDHFKRFNDTFGHRAGDLVLRLVGRLLIDSIKGRDLAARYGGEEFAIVLSGADLHAASRVARQIGSTLSQKRVKLSSETEQGHGRVTISIGIAQFRPQDTIASIIDRADAALYSAKNNGRNRVTTELEITGG